MPPLPTGLTALTSRNNPRHSLPATSIPPPSSFFLPLSPRSISLGPTADGWPLGRGLQKPVGLLFWNFSEMQHRDEERLIIEAGLVQIWGEKLRKNLFGRGKEVLKENTKNCETVQTIPPQCCACSLHLLLPSLFITCVFPSPIPPVLSTVSEIDWGLLVFWYMLVGLLECAH